MQALVKGCRRADERIGATVRQVQLHNPSSETLTAWIDPAKVSRAALEEALKKAQVTVISNQ